MVKELWGYHLSAEEDIFGVLPAKAEDILVCLLTTEEYLWGLLSEEEDILSCLLLKEDFYGYHLSIQ